MMRRRHASASGAEAPLLTREDREEADPLPRQDSTASRGGADNRRGVSGWFAGLWYAFADLMPGSWQLVPDVPKEHQTLLVPFRDERCSVSFNEEDPAHDAMVRRLWDLCSGGRELGPSVVTEEWKQFGFQGTNPATDFRGGGVLGLSNLLYFAETYPASFRKILHAPVQDGEPLPFAIAGINLTMMILNMLNLVKGHAAGLTRHNQQSSSAKLARRQLTCFLIDAGGHGGQDVRSIERVFGDVYSAAFLILQKYWREMRGTLMSFNQVLARVRVEFDLALRQASDVQSLLDAAGVQ